MPEQFACRLAHTVFTHGERLLVCLPDEQALSTFSTRLWSYDDTAFVPHCRFDAPEAPQTPVWLCAGAPAGEGLPGVLLNLSASVPPAPERYARILEIVGCDEASLAVARDRFRVYRSAGCPIDHHDMSHR